MKDIRKFLSGTLIGLLCVCMMQAHTADAASSPSLSASSNTASVAAGDYVNISISLNGNPSITSLGVALGYDSSVLSYDSVSWGSFSDGDMKMASDTGSEVNLSVVCESSYSADGIVATVRFQAISDSSSIPVTLSLRDIADMDLDEITNCKVSDKVSVPEMERKEDKSEEEDRSSGQQEEEIDVAEDSNESELSDTETDNEQVSEKIESRETQYTSVQNAQPAVEKIVSAEPDRNYKTGAGIGSDIFLVIAAVCGILALLLAAGRHGRERSEKNR